MDDGLDNDLFEPKSRDPLNVEKLNALVLQAVFEHDQEAFGHVMKAIFPGLFSSALAATRQREEAKEIVCEVSVWVWEKLLVDYFTVQSNNDTFVMFRAWVSRRVVGMARDRHRSRKRRLELERANEAARAEQLTPLEQMIKEETDEENRRLLEQIEEKQREMAEKKRLLVKELSDIQREAIELVDLKGMDILEAANLAGVTRTNFEARLSRGRKKLRELTEESS